MNSEQEYLSNLLILSGRVTLLFLTLPVIVFFLYKKQQQENSYLINRLNVFGLVFVGIEQILIFSSRNFPPFKEFIHSIGIYNTSFLSIFGYLYAYYLMGLFYKKIVQKKLGTVIWYISLILCFSSIIIFFFIDGYDKQGAVNQTIFKTYSIIIPILGIRELLKQNFDKNEFRDSYFLISLAILISPIITLAMNFYSDKIYESDFILFVKLSILRNVLDLVSIFLFCRAFYKPVNK